MLLQCVGCVIYNIVSVFCEFGVSVGYVCDGV